jgi:phosphoribosylformylglycinamidine cyclo-ligase
MMIPQNRGHRMITYRKAGVNEKKAEQFVDLISRKVGRSVSKNVLADIGFFGGLYKLPTAGLKNPVLVGSCDGVGTKIIIAREMGRFDTIGIDLVAMNVNDVAVCGARVLFFLDYLAVGKLKLDREGKLIEGIKRGCDIAGCALLGGETAQMPDVYRDDDFDLAGFCVGILDRNRILGPARVKDKDVLVGISSNGLHSNGFSLVRKLFLAPTPRKRYLLFEYEPLLGRSLGEELLRPTFIYSALLWKLASTNLIHAAAHITGGGIPGNLVRILPEGLQAVVHVNSWQKPRIFSMIRETGKIKEKEMFNVFNMGIGLIAAVPDKHVQKVISTSAKEGFRAQLIGEIKKGQRRVVLAR